MAERGLNKIIVIGRLGDDPEMQYLPNDKATAKTKLRVAVNSGYGEYATVDWFNVEVFGKQAEACNEFLQKGNRVYVEGSIHFREYEGKWYTTLKAKEVLFL